MISGNEGFAYRFADAASVSEDDVVELLFSLSAINGMETVEQYDRLLFGFTLNGHRIPLLVFQADPFVFTGISPTLMQDLEDAGRFPFELKNFYKDIKEFREGYTLFLDKMIDNMDEFIVAIYRMFNEIKIYDI